MFDIGGEGLSYCNENCFDEKVLFKDLWFLKVLVIVIIIYFGKG